MIRYRRTVRTVESINKLRSELLKHNWKKTDEADTNKAYETFLITFKSLYDEQCPLKQLNRKQKFKERPWMTKGLLNASKNKIKIIPCTKNS